MRDSNSLLNLKPKQKVCCCILLTVSNILHIYKFGGGDGKYFI